MGWLLLLWLFALVLKCVRLRPLEFPRERSREVAGERKIYE